MSDISSSLRRQVIKRAGNRCEYCQLSQQGQEATFHIDHVQPQIANGPTTLENLALACVSCSLRKGARESATDPPTGDEVLVFNPRRELWADHFAWAGSLVQARTPIGRATIALLALNRQPIVDIREEESARGRHPPQ